jgi:hypothetical protein
LKRRKKLATHKDDKQTQPTTTAAATKYKSEQLVRFIHTFHKLHKKPYDKIIKDGLTTTTRSKQIHKQTSEQNANQ